MPACQDLFEHEATPLDVTGNRPLLLGDPDGVWLVQAGVVEVFAVPLKDGEPAGARLHLFSARPGQALFGMSFTAPEGSRSHGLLAVGHPGTRLLQLRRARLQELGAEADCTPAVAALVEGWVDALSAALARRSLPPRPLVLEPGAAVRLEEGGPITPERGVVWVRHNEGSSDFLGRAEITVSGEGYFPVPARGWLDARPGSSVRSETTGPLLADGRAWQGLDRFHAACLACIGLNVLEVRATQEGRLLRKALLEEKLVAGTLQELAAVTHTTAETDAPLATDPPLLAACKVVGARLGLTVVAPRGASERRKFSDPVTAIARASRFRVRRVILSGRWWRQDNGPLLAFRGKEEHPVALLPTSPAGYEVVDPARKTRTPVTAEVAGGLSSHAHCFYRPFPQRPLSPLDLFRFVLGGSGRDWLRVLLLGLVGGVLGLLTPIAVGWVFERIIPEEAIGELVVLVLALGACALAGALFHLAQGLAILRIETRMESAVEAGLWDRLLNLPAPFFRQSTAGDLADRAGRIATIRQVLGEVALTTLLTMVFSLVSFVLLFWYQPLLALMAVGLFVLVVAVAAGAAVRQVRHERRDQEQRGRISGLVLQLITGIARLRVAAAEDRALAVWARAFSQQRRHAFRARSVANAVAAFNAAVPVFASLLLFAIVGLGFRERLPLGVFLAFSAAFAQVLYAAVLFGSTVTSVLQVVPLYERARPILAALPEVDPNTVDPGDLAGDIEVSHVSFRYGPDGPLILDDVSVHIRCGEFVAFVGPSGAGKSTLFRLLLGFEKPHSGSVYYDGEDLAGLDQQAVRRQTGVVLQHGRLLPGDILTSIIGSSLLSLEDAWQAARQAGLEDDIKQMPMGMYTVVSEGESTLSGGQRQRLMIARAIASRPRILFFDEATSALDNASQAKVSKSLQGLKATRVVIAHRLSTVQHADRIHVLDRGKIVQSGSYEELMAREGLFADLARRQLL